MIPPNQSSDPNAPLVPRKGSGSRRVLFTLHTFGQSFLHFLQNLDEAGVEVDLVAHADNPLLASRCLHRTFTSDTTEGAFAALVEKRLQSGEYQLLINGDEPALIALYERGLPEDLQHYLPYPPGSKLALGVGHKDRFQEWCEAENISSPVTRSVHTFNQFLAAAEETGWPCYLKRSTGSGGTTVFRLLDSKDMESHRDRFETGEPWLVQQEVRGVAGCSLFFAADGEVKAWIGLKFQTCMKDGKGPMVVADFMKSPQLGAITRQVAKSSRMTALTGFDFIETDRGEVFLIDSHLGRTTAANHFGEWCGVRFEKVIRRWMDGEDVAPIEPESTATRMVKFPEVIDLLFQKGWGALPKDKPLTYAWGSSKDRRLIIRLGWETLVGNLKVTGGRWRRSLGF